MERRTGKLSKTLHSLSLIWANYNDSWSDEEYEEMRKVANEAIEMGATIYQLMEAQFEHLPQDIRQEMANNYVNSGKSIKEYISRLEALDKIIDKYNLEDSIAIKFQQQ